MPAYSRNYLGLVSLQALGVLPAVSGMGLKQNWILRTQGGVCLLSFRSLLTLHHRPPLGLSLMGLSCSRHVRKIFCSLILAHRLCAREELSLTLRSLSRSVVFVLGYVPFLFHCVLVLLTGFLPPK